MVLVALRGREIRNQGTETIAAVAKVEAEVWFVRSFYGAPVAPYRGRPTGEVSVVLAALRGRDLTSGRPLQGAADAKRGRTNSVTAPSAVLLL